MIKPQENISLSTLTTTQVGGPAKYFSEVKTENDLLESLEYVIHNPIPYHVIGSGSNLLASSEGVNSFIIKNNIQGIDLISPTTIGVYSGTILQDLVNFTISHNLSGFEKLSGIPGTVGGAVYGNAGAFGQTISQNLLNVTVLERVGEHYQKTTLPKSDCKFSYRSSIFKSNPKIILYITFELTPSDKDVLLQTTEEIIAERLKRWPQGIRCPGSFFKNVSVKDLPAHTLKLIPEDKIISGKISAGYFLEVVGAKGMQEGGVKVSEKHANAFINQGSATANDYWQLAKNLKQKVKDKFDIDLEPEVQFINLPSL